MARPLTTVEILAAFKKWGVKYSETSGWKTRSNGGSWNGVTGCMFHHTAMDGSDAVNLNVLIKGHSSLSGPLCNFGVGDDGIVDIVASGPANHAGKGDPDTLKKVQTENYTGNITPDQNSSSPGAVGGNSRFYGWEVYYGIGTDKTIDAIQYRATILSMAAIISALDAIDGDVKWSSKSAIGHKEWTNRKIDPSGVDMSSARNDIQWCLDKGPALAAHWYRTGQRALPTAPPATGDPVSTPAKIPAVYAGTAAEQGVVKAILGSDAFAAPDASSRPDNPFWSGSSWFRYVGEWSREILLTVRTMKTDIAAIKADVAAIKAAQVPAEPAQPTDSAGGTP